MRHRTGRELRELFIRFWEGKGSRHLPSFSLLPDDPSLLFTIAGMVPFKPYYLGIKEPPWPHTATSQKCVRTNDIENVGRTARHHTFFEMLGNFAWGSYFKKEAIAWAWDFLTGTDWIGLDPDRMWATIYLDDEEAFDVWHSDVGLPKDRILRFDQDNNYWFMGDTGPCGPCSEIYYDRGERYGCGKPDCGPGCDCDRYLEVWNLVFTQFDRQKDGSLPPLPHKNIDTGMGLERLTMLAQGVDTDYETDLFAPLIQHTCERAGIGYGKGDSSDMAVRVIADHVRSVAFMLADGALPATDGPGYVLRRLLRRAVRFGKLLGFDGPFLCEYVPILIDIMGVPYRELVDQRPTIEQIIAVEEERFQKTLQQGTELFEEAVKGIHADGQMPGDVAFTLYDTYGFPLELTREMAEEKGLTVDEAGFSAAMEGQRERARASSKQKRSALSGDVYTDMENGHGPTRSTAYDGATGQGKILALLTPDGRIDAATAGGPELEVVLDVTPFYAERGGEVGDTGRMTVLGEDALLDVRDVTAHGGIIVHHARLERGRVAVGDVVSCEVDDVRRAAIRRDHTATHLLHEALGRVLGRHVRQAGSLVTDEFLRFDFTHHSPMTDEEIASVERIVNEQILRDVPVDIQEHSREEAQTLGAKALFDEKYGERVRVVTVPGDGKDAFSMELCGGLHVRATGEIGCFKILREESIGSGTRRILATTGMNVLALLQRLFGLRTAMTALLSTDEDGLQAKARDLVDELRRMRSEAQAAQRRELTERSERFLDRRTIGSVMLQTGHFPGVSPDMLREIGDKAKAGPDPTVVVLASVGEEESCQLVVMADDRAVKLGADAGALVKEASAILGGKGGGRPATAQGGGKDGAKLDEALERVAELLGAQVGA